MGICANKDKKAKPYTKRPEDAEEFVVKMQPKLIPDGKTQVASSAFNPLSQQDTSVMRNQFLDPIGQSPQETSIKVNNGVSFDSRVDSLHNINPEEVCQSYVRPIQYLQPEAPTHHYQPKSELKVVYEQVHGSEQNSKKKVKMVGWQRWKPQHEPVSAIAPKKTSDQVVVESNVVSKVESVSAIRPDKAYGVVVFDCNMVQNMEPASIYRSDRSSELILIKSNMVSNIQLKSQLIQ